MGFQDFTDVQIELRPLGVHFFLSIRHHLLALAARSLRRQRRLRLRLSYDRLCALLGLFVCQFHFTNIVICSLLRRLEDPRQTGYRLGDGARLANYLRLLGQLLPQLCIFGLECGRFACIVCLLAQLLVF